MGKINIEDGLEAEEIEGVDKTTLGGATKRIKNLTEELENVKGQNRTLKEMNDQLDKQLTLKLSTLKDPEQFLPKKTAALEVYKEVVMSKTNYIYSIITAFFIAASSAYLSYLGAIVAGMVCMGFAVMMFKKMQKMKHLEEKYQLVRPGLFKKVQ